MKVPMPQIYYNILALWPDENGLYPDEEFEFYFRPVVELAIDVRLDNGQLETHRVQQNFLRGEEYEYEIYWA